MKKLFSFLLLNFVVYVLQAQIQDPVKFKTELKSLSDTASGMLNGKAKIELETYVQMAYFDRILIRANRRMLTMSSGQYELKREEETGSRKEKAGLELCVIDHYNGTKRSVKTLSGLSRHHCHLRLDCRMRYSLMRVESVWIPCLWTRDLGHSMRMP